MDRINMTSDSFVMSSSGQRILYRKSAFHRSKHFTGEQTQAGVKNDSRNWHLCVEQIDKVFVCWVKNRLMDSRTQNQEPI